METITKHKQDCKMAFGRKDTTCPRCIELINGSPKREGWQASYYSMKKQMQQNEKKYKIFHNECCGSHKDFGICICGT